MIPASTKESILRLKEGRNAVILVHNYQLPEVQDIADYLGDSLGLSQKAAASDADVIVFCGVKFMAETAKILSPKKTVLMPEIAAGCPMANMITADGLRNLQAKHPKAQAVAYVNSNADVKAEVDVCCTSSNAVKVVASMDSNEVIFVPDKYLGHYVSTQVDKKMILWNGYCPTHVKIQPEDIIKLKKKHPDAEVLVHPECTPQVIELADKALSTGGIIKYAKKSKSKEFIIGTEVGILHPLRKENPGKIFYPASELAVCPNMKMTTLNKVLWALQEMKNEVTVPDEIAKKARKSIERMIEVV